MVKSQSVAFASMSGLFLALIFTFIWVPTHLVWHAFGCPAGTLTAAFLNQPDGTGYFGIIMFAWTLSFGVSVYFFAMPRWGTDYAGPRRGAPLLLCRTASLCLLAGAAFLETQHTRICARQDGFGYRYPFGKEASYQWSDVRGFRPDCVSHGQSQLILNMGAGKDVVLPVKLLFESEPNPLLMILNGLVVPHDGVALPLSPVTFCKP